MQPDKAWERVGRQFLTRFTCLDKSGSRDPKMIRRSRRSHSTEHPNTTPSGPSSASKAVGCVCGGPAAPKACSRGARRQEKGIDGGGERSHQSLSPGANRPTQLAGPMHPPQTRRPHPHCPPARRDAPRAVAAPSPAVSVSKSTAVDSATTWVLRLSRDGHIGAAAPPAARPRGFLYIPGGARVSVRNRARRRSPTTPPCATPRRLGATRTSR
eukprot:COSAG02_NODE_346_length_24113_cov_13.213001_9_plen_213_part_00